ncbi:MAG: hypothetical protein ABL893_09090 [Hyphomicrobium sp.]|nr:hypothetical protein [Hyphomicrobium sp.]NOT72506.1 hypothetical protein [Hyphomicrobium sp.]
MLKSMIAVAGFAAVSALATTAPAHAAGKRIRVDNVTPPPTVNVTPSYNLHNGAPRFGDASNAPGGVVVRLGRPRWR